jgi:glycosyltransferase involved in cell wall biosynthesis
MPVPEVSVLLPVFNAADTLHDCIESILSQHFDAFEVVVVNDGSTDDTAAVLDSFDDPRLKCYERTHRGLVRTLNDGLSLCEAPLVARMDADDIMHPQRIGKQYAHMRRHHELVLVASQVEKFPDDSIRAGYREYMRWQNSVLTHDDIIDQIYIESPFAHPSVMFRRDSVIAAGAYRDGELPEDYELWLRLAWLGFRMEKLPQVLLYWRESEVRLSRVSANYAREAFDRVRADYLARDQRIHKRRIAFWGAGRKTRRRTHYLRERGFVPEVWIDIDPKKIGNRIAGVEVVEPAWLERQQGVFVLNYVTNHGARDIARHYLQRIGYRIGRDFLEVG